MSRWFRFYAEALDDPKVQKLDGDTFKAWVNLLCLASRNEGFLPSVDDVAFGLRRSPEYARTLLERLLSAGLLDKLSGGVDGYRYAPHGWAERQYKSDTSTGRVKRFRERSKEVTETPSETEAETEKKPPVAPRKRGASPAIPFPSDWEMPEVASLTPKAGACAEQWTRASYETVHEAFVLHWRNSRKRRPDWPGTWCVWVIREHSKVMRDQKFGNAPTSNVKIDLTAQQLRERAEWFIRHGQTDRADECRQKAVRLESTPSTAGGR